MNSYFFTSSSLLLQRSTQRLLHQYTLDFPQRVVLSMSVDWFLVTCLADRPFAHRGEIFGLNRGEHRYAASTGIHHFYKCG
jgi:hypothetical protein